MSEATGDIRTLLVGGEFKTFYAKSHRNTCFIYNEGWGQITTVVEGI
jgi:hypothetical protein